MTHFLLTIHIPSLILYQKDKQMGLFYLLSEICSFLGIFLEIPATIFKTLAIYFYNAGSTLADNNNDTNDEEE